MFFGPIGKIRWPPGLWLAETFSTSPLKPQNGIQRNLTGSKISTSSTKFVFFGSIGKTRWPPWTLTGWDIFDFFRFLLLNHRTEFNETWQEAGFQRPLYQVCVFGGDQKNGHLYAFDVLITVHMICPPVELLTVVHQGLTRKISHGSTNEM